MSLSVYQVQNVLKCYQKQLRQSHQKKSEESSARPADQVSISKEAKKRNMVDRMADDAVRNLHEFALKPFKEELEEEPVK